ARTADGPERPMPKDPNSVTMNTIIDEFIVPEFLRRPGHSALTPAAIKRSYVIQTKFQHAKLALRIENWRQKIPSLEDGLEWNGWVDPLWKARQGEQQRCGREAQDKKNIEDFVNGRAEGTDKARLICWYVLIPARVAKIWFKPSAANGKQGLGMHRTESMEELDSIEDLIDVEGFGGDIYDDFAW
ncbi:MAG: hypothetical protein Q9211_003434, partial [Gyalolechia sp. 1 TL-2023]